MQASRHRVFASFMLSYVLMLFLPLLIGGIALTEAERVVRNYATAAGLSILEQTRDVMDVRTAEINKMAKMLALSPKLRLLASAESPISKEIYYTIFEMNRELQPYQLTGSFLTTIMLYFGKIDMVISPYAACPLPSFYGSSLRFAAQTEGQWKEMLTKRYYTGEYLQVTPVEYEGNRYSMIPYLQSLPLGQLDSHGAALIMFIDEAQIRKLIERVKVYDYGWIYIADREGRLISSITGARARAKAVETRNDGGVTEQKIEGRPMIVINTHSDYNGWQYVAVLPANAVMGRVGYIRNLTLGVALLSLLSGLVLAYYLAYRNIKPLKEIVRSLAGLFGGKEGTEYEVIRGSVSDIKTVMTDNRALLHEVARQKPLLKAVVMDRLLKGGYRNHHDVEEALAYVGWRIAGRSLVVMILKIAGYETRINREILSELDYIKVLLENILSNLGFFEAYLHYTDQNRFAVVLTAQTADHAQCRAEIDDLLKTLRQQLSDAYQVKLECALGGICQDMLGICGSYDQARQAAEYQMIKNEEVIWYDDLPRETTRYYYPLELEERLLHLAKMGDRQEIGKLLELIQTENFTRRELSADVVQDLRHELKGTVHRMLDGRTDNAFRKHCLDRLAEQGGIDSFFGELGTILRAVCDSVLERGKKSKRNLIDDVINYMKAHYMDTDMSLSTAAVLFKMSPVSLSQLFKDETGENFSDRLETIRMEHAEELLAEPALSVADIAWRLGYNSDKAFRRAFKRVKGMSPTGLRKSILHE